MLAAMSPIDVNFLVVGSGAAGLSAGLRAHDLGMKVLIVEKSPHYGGSTAMSGGVCWVPNNPTMDLPDSDAEALEYLREITGDEGDEETLATYVRESQRLVDYLSKHSQVRFDAIQKYADYYPEASGGKAGGRSMESRPYDGSQLGDELANLRPPHPQSQILGKFGITARQAHTLLTGGWRGTLFMAWCFLGYFLRFFKRRRYGRDTRLYAGNALVGRLRRSLLDRDVELRLGCGLVELITERGRVVGARIESAEGQQEVRASHGVLLAAGGFEKNAEMRARYGPQPSSVEWTAASPYSQGEGIVAGAALGGALKLMDEAWWTPTTVVPRSELGWVLVVEKNLPGSIFVNGQGERFCNEAGPYVDAGRALYENHAKTGTSVPAYMVFDARFRHLYPVGPVAPGYAAPDKRTPKRLKDGFMHRSQTLAELAQKIGLPPGALERTIEVFNGMAEAGEDTDFGRGNSLSDRYYGDPRKHKNPCLAAIAEAPFYAIAVYPGDLGTKGGLCTDSSARVLDQQGVQIPGLYAAGNNAASLMARTYPGAGGTIGPALTFGFLAAETAAEDAL
jgi:3-oxosteroid 1-dehydrogenase